MFAGVCDVSRTVTQLFTGSWRLVFELFGKKCECVIRHKATLCG